jgi:hypothetical protein
MTTEYETNISNNTCSHVVTDSSNNVLIDSKLISKDIIIYKHHDTYEPQIPPHISIFCVGTAHFFLFSGTLYLFCKQPLFIIIGCNLLALYISSVIHWKYSMFDSVIHYVDFVLVIDNVVYTTYVLYTFSNLVFTIWIINISVAFFIFIINEILYYYQIKVPKNILRNNPTFKMNDSNMKLLELNHFQKYFSLEPTWPNTPQREYAYYRSTITHGLFVHGLTGGVAGISVAIIMLLFYQ